MARTNKSKKSSYNFFQSVFFLLVFLTAAYVLTRSSIFEVREIRVIGNTSLSRENIISVAGINPGENIFRIDLKAAAEKLKVVSLIKTVEMSRRLPSAVEIKVAERAACALLPVDTGFIQVDDEGVYIQKGDVGINQLPVVTGIVFDLPQPGEQIKSEKLDLAIGVIRGVSPELPPRLSEIYIEGDQAVVYTLDGIQCRLGASADLKQKGEVLAKILEGLKTKGKRIEYIDLSHAASPVVKYIE
ncbi:MAG: cell division protein FtsQ/DivIB [Bacillota bacterium]